MSNPKTPPPQQPPSPPQQPPSPSQFYHSLTKISVAQIIHSTGFSSATSTALDTLTRVTTLFLRHLSTSTAAAASESSPSLHDVVSAIDDLNFPLDFSIPQLCCFFSTSDHLPFPRLVPKPDFYPPQKPPATAAVDGGCRRAEVPSWLPDFPQIIKDNDVNISSDYDDNDEKLNVKEVYWEKKPGLSTPVVKEAAKGNVIRKTKRGGKKSFLVCGRRERVKFKLGVRKKGDDLELKNGVCRGGKRIRFINRVVPDRFFKFDDGE